MAQAEWFKSLSKAAKAAYIKDHPNSKYAKGSQANKREKNAGIKRSFSRHKKGSLHKALGVELGTKLPIEKLQKLANSNHTLARHAQMVMSLQGHKKNPHGVKRRKRT